MILLESWQCNIIWLHYLSLSTTHFDKLFRKTPAIYNMKVGNMGSSGNGGILVSCKCRNAIQHEALFLYRIRSNWTNLRYFLSAIFCCCRMMLLKIRNIINTTSFNYLKRTFHVSINILLTRFLRKSAKQIRGSLLWRHLHICYVIHHNVISMLRLGFSPYNQHCFQ